MEDDEEVEIQNESSEEWQDPAKVSRVTGPFLLEVEAVEDLESLSSVSLADALS